jgi:lysophospholipid acyltransferase (LPLAT)-like uncharacterized protein
MRAGDGPISLARISGAAIIPAAASVSRRVVLNTWDKLIVALPFGQGATVWGEPIRVRRDASPEEMASARLRLEADLTRVTNTADEAVGAPLTVPAAEQRDHAAA